MAGQKPSRKAGRNRDKCKTYSSRMRRERNRAARQRRATRMADANRASRLELLERCLKLGLNFDKCRGIKYSRRRMREFIKNHTTLANNPGVMATVGGV